MQPSAAGQRRTTWLLTGLACAAMLLLPALVWLLAPRPTPALRSPPRAPVGAAAFSAEPAPAPRRPDGVDRAGAPAAPADPAPQPISGSVVDAHGHTQAGAFVTCDDGRAIPVTTTDERGRFNLPAEAAGCSAVSSHLGFVESAKVTLVAGRDNVLTLREGGAVEGEVVDDRGQPIAAYQLAMESYRGASSDTTPQGQMHEIRDERGAFRWDKLAAGTYVFSASAEGRPPARSRAIDVELGRTAHHVRIVVARGATLSGRVIDAETRKPLAGATVGFDAMSTFGLGSSGYATADEGGAYTLGGAPAGPFSIRVSRDGYVTKTVPGLVTRGADTIRHDVELRRFVEGGPRDELGGIGAILASTPEGVVFGTLIAGGPAAGVGMRRGDRVRRIDGEDASAMTMSDVIQRLRGPEGTIVSVQIEREGKTLDVNIVRKVIAR